MQRTKISSAASPLSRRRAARESGGTPREPRAGYGMMGMSPPGSPARTSLLGPETFPCRPETGDGSGYTRYGVGRMRRGGLEPEEL